MGSDPLEPAVPHRRERTEAKSFQELREEFRENNLKRVRAMTRPDDLQLKDAAGNVVKRVSTGLRTTAPAGQDFRKPDEFLAAGEVFPDFADMPEEFATLPIPQSEARDLSEQSKNVLRGEQVRYPGNPSGDASREGPPLESLDEDALLAYTEKNVIRECGPAALAPHLMPGGDDAPIQTHGHEQICEEGGRAQTPEGGSGAGGSETVREGGRAGDAETSSKYGPLNSKYLQAAARYANTREQGHYLHTGPAAPGTLASFPPGTFYATRDGYAYTAGRYATNSPDPVPPSGWKWWRVLIAFIRRRLY